MPINNTTLDLLWSTRANFKVKASQGKHAVILIWSLKADTGCLGAHMELDSFLCRFGET